MKFDNSSALSNKTAGELVEEYFATLSLGKEDEFEDFISLVSLLYKDNCYLSERKRSLKGKSLLPACYILIGLRCKETLEVLDKDFNPIELGKASYGIDKSSISMLKSLNFDGLNRLSKMLEAEKLGFIKLKDGRILIFPLFLKGKVLSLFNSSDYECFENDNTLSPKTEEIMKGLEEV